MYEEVSKLGGGNRLPVWKEMVECTNSVHFEGVGPVHDTPVFMLGALEIGDVVEGRQYRLTRRRRLYFCLGRVCC